MRPLSPTVRCLCPIFSSLSGLSRQEFSQSLRPTSTRRGTFLKTL
uniref:Uncharacterized protein n=1 Tax=Anguilla anguilla TaxID=7936 RepID=A0A0E9XSH4_ANGAN